MRLLVLAIVTAVIASLCVGNACAEVTSKDFVLRGGASLPLGETGDTWLTGYAIGLDYVCPDDKTLNWGVRANYNRWQADAEGMLNANSGDLFIERDRGWNSISELSGLLQFHPMALDWLTLEGGVGLYHLRWSDVEVKGFVPIVDPSDPANHSAINYEAYKMEGSDLTAGVSLAFSMRIIDIIEPSVRYQYLFSSDDPVSFISIGIGLLAH